MSAGAAAAVTPDAVAAFLDANPDVETVELLFPDLNGVLRGKWLPRESAAKLASGGVRLPISTYALNIWGEDVDEAGLALTRGDPDGIARPVPGGLSLMPWAPKPRAQALMTLEEPDGAPTPYDPRQRLAAVVERCAARGLTPVVAMELEFYLTAAPDPSRPGAPPSPPPGFGGAQVYDLAATDRMAPVLEDIQAACRIQGVPADSVIAEFGAGQFEINLHHRADALFAADAAVLFKRVVRGVAKAHGLAATFMAKPYGDDAGSGLHMHVSMLEEGGRPLFSPAPDRPADAHGVTAPLRHAIGGCLAALRPLQAIFAPHRNSYRRLQPGSYAPVTACWGLDHRAVAVRAPDVSGPAARFEHRICGADANPYLALAAVLGGAMHGLERALEPGEPLAENGDPAQWPSLYQDWGPAVDAFAASDLAETVFGRPYRDVYAACRRNELARWAASIGSFEYQTYLNRL